MSLLSFHIDRQLTLLATGALSDRQWKRLLEHARACARCGPRYERVVLMRRELSHGHVLEPTPEELEKVASVGLPAVLASVAREAPAGTRWARGVAWLRGLWAAPARVRWAGGAALAAVACLALVLGVTRPEETWTPRGAGVEAVMLRVFCVPEDASLVELKEESPACAPGAALAFAAGARAPLTHAAVAVHTEGAVQVEGPFEVRGAPGAEAVLDVTPRLPGSGEVRIVVAFARGAKQALAAARGEPIKGALLVHRRIVVEEAP